MFRRNLIVVFKPIKNNSVLLSESNHRLLNLSDNGHSCLSLMHNRNTEHHIAWASYGGQSIRDTEIGINALVAQEIGLFEGSIVICKLVEDVPVLSSVHVTAANQKDWEMLEVSSYRIQNTLLDQTQIINKGQRLVVWINRAMHITLEIDQLGPDVKYGKLANDTELIVAPYRGIAHSSSVGSKLNGIKTITTDQIIKNHLSPLPSEKLNLPSTNHIAKGKESGVTNGFMNGIKNSYSTSSVNSLSDFAPMNSISKRSSLIFPDKKPDPPLIVKTSDYEHKNRNIRDLQVGLKNKMEEQQRIFSSLLTDLRKNYKKQYQFRIIPSKWEDSQMCDLFATRHNIPDSLDINQIYGIHIEPGQTTDPLVGANDERPTKEFYVNIKIVSEGNSFPRNIYPTVEMNDILMAYLNLKPLDRITIIPKQTVLNFLDRIELYPAVPTEGYREVKIIEDAFKQLIIDNTKLFPILINQHQLFRLVEGKFTVTVKIFPETFRYCLCDSEILRECKINCVEQVKDVSTILAAAERANQRNLEVDEETRALVQIDKFQDIIDSCTKQLIFDLCLDDRNSLRKSSNFLIVGGQNSGKTQLCKQILKTLKEAPFYCYSDVFYCASNKGRKPESVYRDLRAIFVKCLDYSPSILVLDNLDILTQKVAEQTQDGDYFNRVSDVIQQLVTEYTENSSIAIIATVANKSNLNERIYTPRGKHLFHTIYKITNLEKADRQKIIKEMCENMNTKRDHVNYEQFSQLTEGYTIADLVQLVERAVFYAHRNDSKTPRLTHETLLTSLKATNEYCLQGIENHNSSQANGEDIPLFAEGKIPGLESAVSVLEEVLIWPAKYPGIFEKSPLRNQAGVLLFGAPGTGKTLLVGQMARMWNLRMISVKGPELLAKFIGQSEENVRNLFDRARNAKPCVLFFDEFDSLAPRRGHDSTGVTDRVVNQLLTELDGVEGLQGVVVIAATSRPELLDPALLRSGRIDRMVECSVPDRTARLSIFEALSRTASLHFDDTVQLEYFCDEKSDLYTGADIQSILTSANMIAVKECLTRDPENVPDRISISQKHLLEAFENTRPSLSKKDVQRYNQLYARFLNKEKTSRDFVAQRATLA